MTSAGHLRSLLNQDRLFTTSCCYDALSAKLIEQAEFEITLMSRFAVSASRIGEPALGLMSYGEVPDQARNIIEAISIPVIVDGDTGYGNAMNIRHTVTGLARAPAARTL